MKWDNKRVALLGVALLVAGFLIGNFLGYNRALQTVFGNEEYIPKEMWSYNCVLMGNCAEHSTGGGYLPKGNYPCWVVNQTPNATPFLGVCVSGPAA